jgi:hypothetical protein
MAKEKDKKSGISGNVIIYKCYIEDDPLSMSLDEQTKMCNGYLVKNKKLCSRQYVEILDTEYDDIASRPGIKKMFKYIKKYKLINCIIVMASIRVLGRKIRPNSGIIEYLKKQKHSLYIVELNDFIESAHKTFFTHISVATSSYVEELLSEIFYVFSRNKNTEGQTYKGKFKSEQELRIMLEKSGNDTHLEIRCAGNMNRSWLYSFSDGRTISDEIENIIGIFLNN